MILFRIVMTLFLYIRLFINHHDYISIMSLCLKHRVIRVMKIVKRIKNPLGLFNATKHKNPETVMVSGFYHT